jgi:hypothetical protein
MVSPGNRLPELHERAIGRGQFLALASPLECPAHSQYSRGVNGDVDSPSARTRAFRTLVFRLKWAIQPACRHRYRRVRLLQAAAEGYSIGASAAGEPRNRGLRNALKILPYCLSSPFTTPRARHQGEGADVHLYSYSARRGTAKVSTCRCVRHAVVKRCHTGCVVNARAMPSAQASISFHSR